MERPPVGVTSRGIVSAATIIVGALTISVLSQPLSAATATANLSISATVIASCTVTAGSVAFGNYDPTSVGNLDQSGTFTVACTKGTGASVGLNTGANASGATRRMTSGSEFLTYELYKERPDERLGQLGRRRGHPGGCDVERAADADGLRAHPARAGRRRGVVHGYGPHHGHLLTAIGR